MKKNIKKLLAGFVLLLTSAQPALAATCTLNGKVVPCDQMPEWLWVLPIIFTVLWLSLFVFWLRMLLDAIRNQTENKTLWILVIVFCNILGAIIYYFAVKRKRSKKV